MRTGADGALASLRVPVFFAGCDCGDPARVTLHVAPGIDRRELEAAAEDALARAGLAVRCRAKALRHRRLERARSVESLLRAFAHDAILHDPTGSVTRGNALLRCGRALRAALGEHAVGFYFAPEARTLFVLCRVADAAAQRAITAQTTAAIAAWRQEDPDAFDLPVRLCRTVPRLKLVPLDEGSPGDPRATWRGRLHSGLAVGGLATLLGAMLPGAAQADGPAVSAVNGKASVAGGEIDGHGGGLAEGSISFPLGYSFGGQLDAAGGSNGRSLYGLAGQGFWRDPGLGLLGAVVEHSNHAIPHSKLITGDGIGQNRYGVEGEYYAGRFTPSVAVGYQDGGIKSAGGFGVLDLAWYPTDDLQLSAGGDVNSAHSRALLGAEYQLGIASLPGLTTFAEAGLSGHRDSYALFGLRLYFGPSKTLIRRHREDDPSSPIIGGIGSSYQNTANNY